MNPQHTDFALIGPEGWGLAGWAIEYDISIVIQIQCYRHYVMPQATCYSRYVAPDVL